MNMCFGTKNSDKYFDENAKCLVSEASSIETNIEREIKLVRAKISGIASEGSSSESTNERAARSSSEIYSKKTLREETKRGIGIDRSCDASSNGETNYVLKTKDISGKNSRQYPRERKKKFIEESVDEVPSLDAKIDRKMTRVSEKNFNKVPREVRKKCLETERFVGDGLTLRMDTNERDIEVTGDGCRLTMATNHGRIRMIGDGCRLRIGRNSGDIEYTGDGGRVSLGPDSTGRKVHYIGEGGRVDIAEIPIRSSFRKSVTCARGKSATRKKLEQRNADDADSGSEIMDNILNERRSRLLSKTTCKTVRIVNGNAKIVSPVRTKNSVQMDESCTNNS